jgi:hypothetical protein
MGVTNMPNAIAAFASIGWREPEQTPRERSVRVRGGGPLVPAQRLTRVTVEEPAHMTGQGPAPCLLGVDLHGALGQVRGALHASRSKATKQLEPSSPKPRGVPSHVAAAG